jgi:hypothetical protein
MKRPRSNIATPECPNPDDCGLGYANEMACEDMQNASRPEMVAMRSVIMAVKDHPAILGYYMCDVSSSCLTPLCSIVGK